MPKKLIVWRVINTKNCIFIKKFIKKKTELSLKIYGLSAKGADDFRKNCFKWYTEVPMAKDTLCLGFVKALVARHNNKSATASNKVIEFFKQLKPSKPRHTSY